jgi:putative transcriptional regulator
MGVHIELFNINHNLSQVEKGKCLISEPFSPDSFFGRSVILITEHDEEEGTVGYILNKPIEVPFNELFPDFPDFPTICFIGGPVNPESVHFLHTRPDLFPDSHQVLDNIYWGGNFDHLKGFINKQLINPRDIRIFLGYSGWAPKQLKQEINDKYWVVSDIQSKTVMNANVNTWKEILLSMGESYALWAKSPVNPGMN